MAMFCWAMTVSAWVSYIVKPAMKREPSGAMESTVDWPATVRCVQDHTGSHFVHKHVGGRAGVRQAHDELAVRRAD